MGFFFNHFFTSSVQMPLICAPQAVDAMSVLGPSGMPLDSNRLGCSLPHNATSPSSKLRSSYSLRLNLRLSMTLSCVLNSCRRQACRHLDGPIKVTIRAMAPATFTESNPHPSRKGWRPSFNLHHMRASSSAVYSLGKDTNPLQTWNSKCAKSRRDRPSS